MMNDEVLYMFVELSPFKHRSSMDYKQVVQQYREACARVAQVIKESSFKASYWMQQLGFEGNRSGYYARLSTASWEPKHLEIVGLLQEEESRIKGKKS